MDCIRKGLTIGSVDVRLAAPRLGQSGVRSSKAQPDPHRRTSAEGGYRVSRRRARSALRMRLSDGLAVVPDAARRPIRSGADHLFAARRPSFSDTEIEPGQDLRRPGGDRDRERAPLQRDQEAPSGRRRRPRSCASSANRRRMCNPYSTRSSTARTPLQRRPRQSGLAAGRRALVTVAHAGRQWRRARSRKS